MARPRKFPPGLLDRGARVVIVSGRPIARTVPVTAGGSAQRWRVWWISAGASAG